MDTSRVCQPFTVEIAVPTKAYRSLYGYERQLSMAKDSLKENVTHDVATTYNLKQYYGERNNYKIETRIMQWITEAYEGSNSRRS